MKYIKDIYIINKTPNFTIILPVDCNANCSFCSWKSSGQENQERSSDFLNKLKTILENLPAQFKQITISGGEPTLYKDLLKVLMLIGYHKPDKIQKVVFTTNGAKLSEVIKNTIFTEVVDYVNISRHSEYQGVNDEIMQTKTIMWNEIKNISEFLGTKGIPVNINCVIEKGSKPDNFLDDFKTTARNHFINSITFRADYNDGFGISDLEKQIQKYFKPIDESECPVCIKNHYIINGMDIYFTASEMEPKNILGDDVYEFILQPNGNLTQDWEGKEIISLTRIVNIRESEHIKSSKPITLENTKGDYIGRDTFEGCGHIPHFNGC